MGGPSVPHLGKISISDLKDRVISSFDNFVHKSFQPFYKSLQPLQQWILLLTLVLAIPYFLNGDFFKLLKLISVSVKGGEVSVVQLLMLSTVTFLLLYCSTLVINYKAKLDDKKKTYKDVFEGVHACITFSKIPEYLKGPRPQSNNITPITPKATRFKEEFPVNEAFNKVFDELAKKKYTPQQMPYFTDNPFDNMRGSQSRAYELFNPGSEETTSKIETMNGLDFLNQKTETETSTK